MADKGEGERIRDPLEEGEDKSSRLETSSSREESMTESGKDAFGDKSAVRNPDSASQGQQHSSSSGTTPLTGEPSDAESRMEPGGVEGARDDR